MFEDIKMEKDWRQLIGLFCKMQDPVEMEKLLLLFLTINEREYLVDRFRIIRALLQGTLTQREIAEQCHVSIAKITAGSNELKRTPVELKEMIKKSIQNHEEFTE